MNSQKSTLIATLLGVYLIVAGISYVAFTKFGTTSSGNPISNSELESTRAKIEAAPKTEVCPMNGEKYSTVERDIWLGRRPITAVIENSIEARPQSGMSRADVVYEAVAEGGITRFLNVFYCNAGKEDIAIGPLRSARIYFINLASEYGEKPLFVHFGGANNICGDCFKGVKAPGTVAKEVQALERLIDMGWRSSTGNALDGGANVSFPTIRRDQTRLGTVAAWEHTAIGSTDLLFKLGNDRGFGNKTTKGEDWLKSFVPWKFVDGAPVANPTASTISFEFWRNKPDFDVKWTYKKDTNSYMRDNGGKPHTDWEFNKPQLSAKNVVIQYVKEKGPVDKELHMYYEVVGTGNAMVFQNGDVIQGTWKKPTQFERTRFYDSKGAEISFVRGVIFVELIPDGNKITYN